MIDTEKITQGMFFYHKVISELAFDKYATADLLGCDYHNLTKIRGKNGLNPLRARYKRRVVYAQSDIENYLKRRD